MVLYFANDNNLFGVFLVFLSQNLPDILDVFTVSGEWNCYEIDFMLQSEIDNVVLVIRIYCWQIDYTSR